MRCIMKKNKKLVIISIVAFIILFVVFIIMTSSGTMEEQTIENWDKKTTNGYPVVTIIGSTKCSHCQEYKPVITALAKKYKFKLFFFEVNEMEEEETEILYNKYELENYDGHIPYTYIVNNNKFISDKTGFASREDTIEFLKQNGIIKN